jgi:transposase-like protein
MVWSPPPTDDQCREAFQASQTLPTLSDAARSIGHTVTCLKWRIKLYHDRGLGGEPLGSDPPGFAPLDSIERHRMASEISRLRGVCKTLT